MVYQFVAEINAGIACIEEKEKNCDYKIGYTSCFELIISFHWRLILFSKQFESD